MIDNGLFQHVSTFNLKITQLYETLVVRHGVMLVGATGSGKTVNRDVMKGALTYLREQVRLAVQCFRCSPRLLGRGGHSCGREWTVCAALCDRGLLPSWRCAPPDMGRGRGGAPSKVEWVCRLGAPVEHVVVFCAGVGVSRGRRATMRVPRWVHVQCLGGYCATCPASANACCGGGGRSGPSTGIFASLLTERYLWSYRPLTSHISFCALC